MCAIGVLDRLQKRGMRVPEDVSVTGFDDDRIADLHGLSLTTVNPLKLEQARRAVDCAIERVDDGRTERAIHEFTPSLVVRRTTAPAPARTSRRTTAARRAAQA
jgi:DNA-binding LacI/PurR family transcriptional regulator